MSRKNRRKKTYGFRITGLFSLLLCIFLYISFEPAAEGVRKKLPGYAGTGEAWPEAWPKALEIPAPSESGSEMLLQRKNYTLSYNREWKLPNWVAWETDIRELETKVSRSNRFIPDPDLPAGEAVCTGDYAGCGMDRGHMCPAADNRWDATAMKECFYMTNICPQNSRLNRGDWKELEEKCREWVRQFGKIYVVCGPVVKGESHRTIGRKLKVTVPEAFFKVIFTPSPYPKAIGFLFGNEVTDRPLKAYSCSVDKVEETTGIDFFPSLEDSVEIRVEANGSLKGWN